MNKQSDRSELHLTDANFLAQILRCSPNHLPSQKDAYDDVKQHVDHSNSLTAEDTIQPHPKHKRQTSKRIETIGFSVGSAAGHICHYRLERGASRSTKSHLLTLEVAKMLIDRHTWHRRQGYHPFPSRSCCTWDFVHSCRMGGQRRVWF